jgi:DNA invertase Pin-like site-specific DNA recombinase
MIVGYARVSTPSQKLERQIANLKNAYPDIVIISEKYTGKTENRPK